MNGQHSYFKVLQIRTRPRKLRTFLIQSISLENIMQIKQRTLSSTLFKINYSRIIPALESVNFSLSCVNTESVIKHSAKKVGGI